VDFYSIPVQHNRRSTSFGFGKRTEIKIETKSPAPGHYTLPEICSKGRKISTSNLGARLKFEETDSPGPGSYSLKPPSEGPSFSFKPKPKAKEIEVTPSAGNYNPNFACIDTKSFSKISFGYGHKTVFSKNKDIPGPGSYSVPSFFPVLKSSFPHSFKKSLQKMSKINE
jgi:hypothetical protein